MTLPEVSGLVVLKLLNIPINTLPRKTASHLGSLNKNSGIGGSGMRQEIYVTRHYEREIMSQLLPGLEV